jgi:hypothetical protein
MARIGEVVDGQDALAVYQAACRAAARARRGEGPTLLEMKTYRYHGHYVGDAERHRSREEVAEWRARDPLRLLEARMVAEGRCDRAAIDANLAAADREIDAAETFGVGSPLPPAELALEYVFAPSLATEEQPGGESREAMRAAMAADRNVVVMGEDVHWAATRPVHSASSTDSTTSVAPTGSSTCRSRSRSSSRRRLGRRSPGCARSSR